MGLGRGNVFGELAFVVDVRRKEGKIGKRNGRDARGRVMRPRQSRERYQKLPRRALRRRFWERLT
jgi:hypothetical protein